MKSTPHEGWKSKAVCIDGPAAGVSLHEAPAKEVVLALDDGKLARYKNVGRTKEVPPADGVGLRFQGYVEKQ